MVHQRAKCLTRKSKVVMVVGGIKDQARGCYHHNPTDFSRSEVRHRSLRTLLNSRLRLYQARSPMSTTSKEEQTRMFHSSRRSFFKARSDHQVPA